MKTIQLTQGKVAMVDDEDFEWLNKWNWYAAKHGNTFYVLRRNGSTFLKMHRLILGITDPEVFIDHIDMIGTHNYKSNLRIVTRSQNGGNSISSYGTSQYKGVCWSKYAGKWKATIMVNYKSIHLGFFKYEIEAAIAYNIAAKEYFGEFALLNII